MFYQKTDLHYQSSTQMFANGIFFLQISLRTYVTFLLKPSLCELHFQTHTEETLEASAEPKPITIAETDEVLKGLLLWLLFSCHFQTLKFHNCVCFCKAPIKNFQFVLRGLLSAKFWVGLSSLIFITCIPNSKNSFFFAFSLYTSPKKKFKQMLLVF